MSESDKEILKSLCEKGSTKANKISNTFEKESPGTLIFSNNIYWDKF